jgi:hypothetical protein
MLHGFRQNHAGPKNMCKQTRKKKTIAQTELDGWVFRVHVQADKKTSTQTELDWGVFCIHVQADTKNKHLDRA